VAWPPTTRAAPFSCCSLLQWLSARGKLAALHHREYEKWTRGPIQAALQGGHIPILEWHWINERNTWSNPHRDFALSWEVGLDGFDSETESYECFSLTSETLAPGVLQWGASIGLSAFIPESTLVAAAITGDIDGLDAMLMRNGELYDFSVMPSVFTSALLHNQSDIVDRLLSQGAAWDYRALAAAAQSLDSAVSLSNMLDHVSSLQMTAEQQSAVFTGVFRSNDVLGCLRILVAAGFPLNSAAFLAFGRSRHWREGNEELRYFLDECPRGSLDDQQDILVAFIESFNGDVTVPLQALFSAGFELGPRLLSAACMCSNRGLALRDFLWSRQCPFDGEAATLSAVKRRQYYRNFEKGCIETLEWLQVDMN
jgi:hypothetical protein